MLVGRNFTISDSFLQHNYCPVQVPLLKCKHLKSQCPLQEGNPFEPQFLGNPRTWEAKDVLRAQDSGSGVCRGNGEKADRRPSGKFYVPAGCGGFSPWLKVFSFLFCRGGDRGPQQVPQLGRAETRVSVAPTHALCLHLALAQRLYHWQGTKGSPLAPS